jgi:hypothetical protein
MRKEQQEIIKLEKINKIETDAKSIYELYKCDFIRDDGIVTWKASKVTSIKNAYAYYCLPSITDKSDNETTKKPMVEALGNYFKNKENQMETASL